MSEAGTASLTEKQIEVLEMTLLRMSSKEIARELGISFRSVDKRLDGARMKLGAATRGEAARIYGLARYGESLPGQLLSVQEMPVPPDERSRTPHDGWKADDSVEHPAIDGPVLPPWWSALGRSPREIGKVGRIMLVLVGSLVLSLIVLVGLGITQGFERVLFE